ncbi:programmed cell death protein, putative [Ricinus communis]|uniref:Programmed cell death protein, putative n=1 Tax=Ricinus communis TaxID=3988 RepID=B9T015_RICCO|nr:programmed cell death protein, putative [Ricinus communis]
MWHMFFPKSLYRSELGIEPGNDASSMYHVGQVVKCRVLSSLPASRRINLSFTMKPTRVPKEEALKLGSVVAGVVEKVTSNAVIVYVNSKGYTRGIISTEHLADRHEQAALFKSVLKPGYEFDQLLVLDIENNNLVLSAKYSLVNSAHQLPSDLTEIHPQSIVHGYICNLIDTGCFVRFLGRLTGFSPKSKAMDNQKAQLSEAFYIGQSVRSNIIDVSSETNRITVSLKQSSCSSTDASFLQEYFLVEEKVAELQSSDSKGPDLKWVEGFNIGTVVEAKVEESKEVGIVVSFDKYNDVLGFITHYQLGGTTVETGSTIRAAVLDVAKTEHLVDLSLKPEFLDKCTDEKSNSQTHKKKRKREVLKNLEVYQSVTAVVEIVKENYMASALFFPLDDRCCTNSNVSSCSSVPLKQVLSIPEHNYIIGYASVSDYNIQKLPQKQFLNGQSVVATVMALPSSSTAGRLLLLLKSISEITETSSTKKAKKKSSYKIGSLVQAEVNDDCFLEDPFTSFKIGQTVTARIVAKTSKADKNQLWELSIKPKVLTDFWESEDKLMSKEFEFSSGHRITGYVYKVDSEWAWLTISRHLKAQLFILDSACEPSELQEFQKRFFVGKAVSGYVLSYNKEKTLLRLVQRPLCAVSCIHVNGEALNKNDAQNEVRRDNAAAYIQEGDIVGGKISKILSGVGGVLVQIGPHVHGKVHYTELQESWVPNPLDGYREGQFVKCKVLEISRSDKGTTHIDLSLRFSLDGMLSQNSSELSKNADQRVEKIDDLQPNTVVQGYVKNVAPKGCFIFLSRKIDAKILLSNLSDEFVVSPEEEFPIGKLVTGRVLSVEPLSKRVEVTLKKNAKSTGKSELNDLSRLNVGDTASGRIKRVEPYGLFIAIDHTNLVGLCHVSELSDDHVDSVETKYRAGEKVTARILKVDVERRRISLGIKNLDNGNDTDILPSQEESSDAISENGTTDDGDSKPHYSSSPAIEGMDIESENEEHAVLAHAESRASIPPLNVTLDDVEHSDVDDTISQTQEQIDKTKIADEKDTRQAKKKVKEEREQEIRAAEERLLEKDIPRTADEFEKLVHGSPNNSFVWIKYMAFMLDLADIEKARSIAERALRTINFREENEKLNVWVAYFNLENEYGNPPEEAVKNVFQRALQYCDPKKVHLALLGVYERTEQHKLADELLDRMVKKFKISCKIWLRRVQRHLKQEQDGVQSTVKRALLSLPRHKHIKFISQAAILEFKCGVPDRGRSMFEGILREYPKRTDLWSVYLDQEIRLGDVDVTRTLFERATSLSLPAKKMQFLFKKYLEYEKSVGDEEQIESVKKKAMEYVESTMA